MPKIDKQENGCWIWRGATVKNKYGHLRARTEQKGKQFFVYRLMFEIEYGVTLPPDLLACHTCDNGLCVNPEHIFIGSVKSNTDDMIAKGRAAWQKNPTEYARQKAIGNSTRHYQNETGFRGVYRAKGNRFGSRIKRNGANTNLGTFNTAQEAHDAYLKALEAVRKGAQS